MNFEFSDGQRVLRDQRRGAPRERAATARARHIRVMYAQEDARDFVPRGYFEIGLGMCIPTLMAHDTGSRSSATSRRP
jgi:hypothetical protein